MAVAVLGIQFFLYSKYLLPLYVLLGGVVYLVMLRFLRAVRVHDIHLVKAFAGKRFARLVDWVRPLLIS